MSERQPPIPAPLRDPGEWLSQLVERDLGGEPVALHPFFGHQPQPHVGDWVFSQWASVAFTFEGREFANAEVAMMSCKARLFADSQTLAELLTTTDPGRAKALGRSVRGFDQETWDAHAYGFVVAINLAKFSQHPDLAAHLATTAPAVLVEASPYDRIWGIGLGRGDSNAHAPARWRGKNLLGFALTEVRSQLG